MKHILGGMSFFVSILAVSGCLQPFHPSNPSRLQPQTDSPQRDPSSDASKRMDRLETRIKKLEERLSVFEATGVPGNVQLQTGASLEKLRAENRQLKDIIEKLAIAGVPWVRLTKMGEDAFRAEVNRADRLIQGILSAKDAEEREETANALESMGRIAIFAILHTLANESVLQNADSSPGITPEARDTLQRTLARLNAKTRFGIQTKVLDAQPKAGFVVLAAGKRRGVVIGTTFSIFRNGEFLALAQVDQVFSDVCRAKIVGPSQPVRPGDLATASGLNSTPSPASTKNKQAESKTESSDNTPPSSKTPSSRKRQP